MSMHAAELLLFEALVKEPLPSLLLFFLFLVLELIFSVWSEIA